MDLVKEYFWNDSLRSIEYLYGAELPFPLTSYFYLDGNQIIFDPKKELNHDVKKVVQLTFEAIFKK